MKKDSPTFKGELGITTPEIYLSIDHLKKGVYIIHITIKDRVIETVRVTKT
ncbi:MAG: hypothetical protein AAFP76_04415 [Bacteroidota bacterium]